MAISEILAMSWTALSTATTKGSVKMVSVPVTRDSMDKIANVKKKESDS